ncbi:hypothetical protein BSKO_07440 [Bryopsis sp. KO-2023]|nr:hypothetical protein BSKO_07440 [Bryopsis sp. KO-2023]
MAIGKDPGEEEQGTTDLEKLRDVRDRAEKATQRLQEERKRREQNVSAQQLSEDELKKFESSVKRNTALIKKLKAITEETCKSLCQDILKVNQSRYVSEAVLAIAETPIKGRDISAAVEVCSTLHRRYAEFSPGIVDALSKAYQLGPKGGPDDDKSTAVRKRSCIRLMVELYLAGVFDEISVLAKVIKDLVSVDYRTNPEAAMMHLMLLTSFAKVGREHILGLSPKPAISLPLISDEEELSDDAKAELERATEAIKGYNAECTKRFVLVEDHQKEFWGKLERVYEGSCEVLLTEHEKLQQLEQDNMNVLNTKGELPEDLATAYEKKRTAFEALQRGVASYAESLDKDVPELPEGMMTRVDAVQDSTLEENTGPAPLFEDAETQAFYQTLPDLRAVVPAVLLGLTDKTDEKDKKEDKEEEGERSEEAAENPEAPPEENEEKPEKIETNEKPEAEKEKEEDKDDSGGVPDDGDKSGKEGRSRVSAQELDALLSRLPTCVTRDGADEIAVNFCYMNSKPSRKRLMRALCDVPKASLQLLPFYSRIAAILSRVFPEVANGIVTHLEEEFSSLMSRKDASSVTLEPRIRNMRYMGELCKFRLIHFGTVFTYLKQLLDEFTHHNIDAACALIETAGGFLIRLPETQIRMENMLEQMTRLKNAKNLDSRHRALIDSAYFQCKPPKSGVRRKRRPPIQEYIRHLIYNILAEDTIRHVLKKLRRLPWAEYERTVVHFLVKATGKRYSHVSLVASLCAGLSKYHETLAVAIVDEVFEEVQQGLEQPGAGFYQRRVAHVRLLGELYNYRLLDSRTVFESMYWTMNFGKENPEEAMRLDGPTDTFRIRMICTILDTCGRYFAKGTAKRKLDRFLVFFQRYMLSKPPLTMDMEFDIADLFERLRPELKRFATFEESQAAVEVIEAQEAQNQGDDESSSESDSNGGDSDDVAEQRSGAEDGQMDVDEVDLDDENDAVGLVRKQTQETDEEFERELKALLHHHQRLNPAMMPMRQVQSPAPAPQGAAEGGVVPFKMLLRRGGKDDKTKELSVPLTVSLAVQQLAQQDLEAQERSKIKELVLAANLKDEQEELLNAGIHIRRQSEPRIDRGGPFMYGGRRYSSQRRRR